MESADPIFPAEIITLILGKIDPIVRLSFRAVSIGLMREIKKPARKPTPDSIVCSLVREGMYAAAIRYVSAAKTITPASNLLMVAYVDNNAAVACSLLKGRLAPTADRAVSSLVSCTAEYNPEVLEIIIKTVPGLSLYHVLCKAVLSNRISLVKFILTKNPRMCEGLCKAIGSSCSIEMLYLLERVWNFPRDPSKTEDRLGTIVEHAIYHGNKQDVIDLISIMLLDGVITPDLIIWNDRVVGCWTLNKIAREHRCYAWLQACGL